MDSYYITTPIYYVNAKPHLGHAYSTIIVDILKRFHSMIGEDARMQTGTDEHGDKIVKAASAQGVSPQAFVDNISGIFRGLWSKLNIEYDGFIRTTNPSHKKAVQALLQRLYDKGDIYYGEYGGYYCYGCERFYTEKELENGLCPQHLTAPEFISEKNYFFKMSAYQEKLKQYILEHPDFIRPERYKNEVLAMLEDGVLEDLCISRPKSRLTWGIELPFDKEYVSYVWFDALSNYITALGWPDDEQDKSGLYKKYWPGEHLIAKDILKPHGVFWPTMLMAADIPLFKHLNVHGYWLVKDTKMSKSLGNVVDPLTAAERFGLDAFRYFLVREMSFGSDASYSPETLITRINADLSNDLGNLFSRVLSMNGKYFQGMIPALSSQSEEDKELSELTDNSIKNYVQLFNKMQLSQAVESLWVSVRAMNKYIETQAPWTLAKNTETERLSCVIRTLLENMYKISYVLWPIMPETSTKMQKQLGKEQMIFSAEAFKDLLEYPIHLKTGQEIEKSSNLFPRLEFQEKESANIQKTAKSDQKQVPVENKTKSNIEFADFQKIELRVGCILKAEQHPNADKLLCFDVDLGESQPRKIVSGIAKWYNPEELINKKVIVVANLPVKKLRGVESHGMLLTAEAKDGSITLLTADAPAGSIIS